MTNGERILAYLESEARWEIIRRRFYLLLACVAVAALVWIALK